MDKQTLNAKALAWEEFKAVFNRKYFHSVILQGRVKEFSNLHQGNLSVTESIKRFNQLARLVPHGLLVKGDSSKDDAYVPPRYCNYYYCWLSWTTNGGGVH